jgi:hypothetical protein
MAGMTTALAEFAGIGNSRTSTTSGHTIQRPKLVIERRTVAEGKKTVAEYEAKVVQAAVDPNDLVLRDKVQLSVISRVPVAADSATVDAAIVILRDIVASDEFVVSVKTQNWL